MKQLSTLPRLVGVLVLGLPAPALAQERLAVSHGPMLGRPGATSMGVWARTSRPGGFVVHYGTAADRLEHRSAAVTTGCDRDNTGWVLLRDLRPDTRYHYQVVPNGEKAGPGGTFRTLPDAAGSVDEKYNPRGLFNFSFEVSSCANQGPHSLGPAQPLYRRMLQDAKDRVYFGIHNGDFIYEEAREVGPARWSKEAGCPPDSLPRVVQLDPAITGVWENYKLYLSRGKNLAAWHRDVPSYFTFDDHEILNDVVACGQTGYRHRRTVFRDPAVQAWYDYVGWSNPVPFEQGIQFGRASLEADSDVLTDAEADFTRLDLKQAANLHVHWGTPDAGLNVDELDSKPGDPNAGVYAVSAVIDRHRLRITPRARKTGQAVYSIGRRSYYNVRVGNCDFYFLDTRTHRQMHDYKNPSRPGISMLGKGQREWLLESMKASDADFFFVVSSVNFTIPHVGSGGMAAAAADKDDAWTAFAHEREELIAAWERLERPVLVFTGDLHNSWAVKLTDRIWEFGAGPLNSENHPLKSEGGRPPNGPFNSRGRKCEIRWSTFFLDDLLPGRRGFPAYAIVKVNNVFANPAVGQGKARQIAYPQPQVVVQFRGGPEGDLLYAESVLASPRPR